MKYYRNPYTESKKIAPGKSAMSPNVNAFFVEKNRGTSQSVRFVRGVSECSVSCIRILGKAARVRTDAMEKQDHVHRGGRPKTPRMRFVVAVRLP